ncbi:MAG TPA: 1-phosphofructokinase family hexose kinase [Anaerolineales bacterium]|jgi:1-phosphofructokinase family hexose kinase|nr:1-phosphofructokinase family hexose kinase [Anaerolineales bacterium]
MIITLTPNTGIDYTLQIADVQLNKTIRAIDTAWGMGGKATDVSWILGKLGVPTRALGFAAGRNGARMEEMLRARGVETDFVWAEGETRLNVILIADAGQSTITSPSLMVSPEQVSNFTARYQTVLDGASCVVMGGSLPVGLPFEFYAEAIAQAHAHEVPVIFDSSGPSLLAGIRGRPEVIKPNLTELSELVGYVPASRQEIKGAARKLYDEYGSHVIITMGSEGAIAVFAEESYFIHPLSIPVMSVAGTGDGVLAGIALAYLRKESFEYGLQHGFALAGAILKTLPTADFEIQDYQDLLSQIRIEPL